MALTLFDLRNREREEGRGESEKENVDLAIWYIPYAGLTGE